jgi:mRNA-degrading endonuclease RelE of RelBE toxin-antitoxin system
MLYQISFAPQVREHLRCLTAREQEIVLDEIERQLGNEPTVETRHRKRLRPNAVAPWQLSVADFRVLYTQAGKSI